MKNSENILGKEKIGKLMLMFAVPCIISMLVNSLYNIVDQIFIGWGVGYLGNGATNVVFPINMICLAFALMIGDGTSAYLSLKLGENKKDEASKGVLNGIIMSFIIAICFCAIVLLFLPQLLNLFGCTEKLKSYALGYGYIIGIGLPFMIIGTSLNSMIRADGNPKYSMLSMLSGAILNVILDPIFIFVFNLGVKGAAIATVISQVLTFVINILYIRKFKSIDIKRKSFGLSKDTCKMVLKLGVSSFITQMSIVLVMAFENNLLGKYGASSSYGAEIPITVLGIVMKMSQILNSIIIGLAVGAQPILGYNYGAGKLDRVFLTLKKVLCISLIISTTAFLLFQLVPDKLILLFGQGNDLYIEFACLAFRIYLMLVICNGIQVPSGIFFQAIGKSGRSAVLSLSRQIIFLIPGMVILGHFYGIKGVLYAGPIADLLAFILSVTFLSIEVKNLKKLSNEDDEISPIVSTKSDKKIVITIAREYGSGGRYVGKLLSEKLNIPCYDKELIYLTAKESGLTKAYIEENEQQKKSFSPFYSMDNELFFAESKVIKKLAKNSCIIIGRCADYVLEKNKNVYRVFLYNSDEAKVKRACKYYGLNKEKALAQIKKINKAREKHYNFYTNRKWTDMNNYDICLDVDALGLVNTALLLADIIEKKIDNKS